MYKVCFRFRARSWARGLLGLLRRGPSWDRVVETSCVVGLEICFQLVSEAGHNFVLYAAQVQPSTLHNCTLDLQPVQQNDFSEHSAE